jgi:hypothetical protein
MASATDDGRMAYEDQERCPRLESQHENTLRPDRDAVPIYLDEDIERFLDEDELNQELALRVSLWLTPDGHGASPHP